MTGSRTHLANAAHQAMLQRSELQRSLGFGRSEIQPSALVDRGKYHVKAAAHDAGTMAQEHLSANRLLIGAAAVGGTAWLLRDPIRENGPDLFRRAGKAVKKFAASINRALDPAARPEDYIDEPEQAAETVHDKLAKGQAATLLAAKHFQEELEDKMKPLGQTARETRDKASELAERTAESARHTAEAAKARVQDGYARARTATADIAAKGREQAEVAKHAAGSAYEKSKEKAGVATTRVKDFASEQPLTLIAGALAAGLLIGTLLSGKDDETK
jgi:ElaB/YqjD/DUF883 family membrane-anchored ribosome-binding protein